MKSAEDVANHLVDRALKQLSAEARAMAVRLEIDIAFDREIADAIRQARREGAEAMKEKAIRAIEANAPFLPIMLSRSDIIHRISALPLEEGE